MYAPEHEEERRERARVKWLSILAHRPGGVWLPAATDRSEYDELDVLRRCFKIGEPAANCLTILATGESSNPTSVGGTYYWRFRIPNEQDPDGRLVVMVVVSERSSTIEAVHVFDPAVLSE